jgi:hypothetical protein
MCPIIIRINGGLLRGELGTTFLEMLGSHAVIIMGSITHLMEEEGRVLGIRKVSSRSGVRTSVSPRHSTTQSMCCRCFVCASQPRPPVEKN